MSQPNRFSFGSNSVGTRVLGIICGIAAIILGICIWQGELTKEFWWFILLILIACASLL